MPLRDYQVGSNDLTSARFQARYEPNFAMGNAVGVLKMLPQLRGIWAMSSVDANGDVFDFSGQGHTLVNTSATPFGVDGLVPYADPDGAADYLSHVDHADFQITGALTMGGWFWVDSLSVTRTPMSKWTDAGNQRGYVFTVMTTGEFVAVVSTDGTATVTVSGTVGEVPLNTWKFCAMRFTPSTELASWVNKTKHVNTTSIPATIFNNNAAFMIGGVNAAASLNGRAAL